MMHGQKNIKTDDEFAVLSHTCKVIDISSQHDHEKEKKRNKQDNNRLS